MSIQVPPDDLGPVLDEFGPGYLITNADSRQKVIRIDRPGITDGALVIVGAGRGTVANVSTNPLCTLLFPPSDPHGYSLIVDGTAVVDGDELAVTPSGAVLHRPAAHADGPPPPTAAGDPAGCDNDCRPVTEAASER